MCTVEPLYSGHHWDCSRCPHFRGRFVYECCCWDSRKCSDYGVSLFQSVLFREVPLTYTCILSVKLWCYNLLHKDEAICS